MLRRVLDVLLGKPNGQPQDERSLNAVRLDQLQQDSDEALIHVKALRQSIDRTQSRLDSYRRTRLGP
jgi:hypothetical protein